MTRLPHDLLHSSLLRLISSSQSCRQTFPHHDSHTSWLHTLLATYTINYIGEPAWRLWFDTRRLEIGWLCFTRRILTTQPTTTFVSLLFYTGEFFVFCLLFWCVGPTVDVSILPLYHFFSLLSYAVCCCLFGLLVYILTCHLFLWRLMLYLLFSLSSILLCPTTQSSWFPSRESFPSCSFTKPQKKRNAVCTI